MIWVSSPDGFSTAWLHSRQFWQQTLAAAARHLPLLLAVAVVPAALRAYLTLKRKPVPRWEFNLAEALLTLWRILICAVAIWVTLTPREWYAFKLRLRQPNQLQLAMQRLGAYLGRSIHMLLWELLFFALGLWLLHLILSLIADLIARAGRTQGEPIRRKALGTFLHSLILTPLALIYLVTIARQGLS